MKKNPGFIIPNWVKIVFFILFCDITFTKSSYTLGDLVSVESEKVPFDNTRDSQSVTYKYDRINEVKMKCSSVLDSNPNLKPDVNHVYSIKKDLSFVNGDWYQDNYDKFPLMPFDSRSVWINGSSGDLSPSNLASFWVTDVARSQPSKKYITISGILKMGIALGGSFDQKPYEEKPRFDIWPGLSELSVIFQGIYLENEEERVMCLLGETMLPSRNSESTDPWEWVKEPGFMTPPLLQDEQILLVLNYPKTFNLTSQEIKGSMRSLNFKTNAKYFDEVHISSSLGTSSNYEFGSEKITCSPSYADMSSGIESYKGLDFCRILQRISPEEGMTILPNWKCNRTDELCSKLGPFSSDKLINATDGGFKDVKLVLQNVRCKIEKTENGKKIKVSSVFRVVDPFEVSYIAGRKTGISNMTLSAEGEWNSTDGKLCMIGCIGVSKICNSRIVLHIPLMFSITQRSIVTGTISSIKSNSSYFDYFPLSFEMLVRDAELYDQYRAARPYYKYSKIAPAVAVLEKDEPFSFDKKIKKSFLNYPKVESFESLSLGISDLAEDLTIQTSAYPDRTNIQLEIISIGSLFGRYWRSRNVTNFDEENRYETKSEYTEKQLLVNVSAQLTLSRKHENNISIFFLEGIYDEHVGKMYLIGCRDVRKSWKVLFDSMDLENGLDCLIETIVSYPPTTTRWLISPKASISINSQRNEDDPLYFKAIKLETLPIMYRRQREDILSRRGIEGILRILTLSVAISCIFSQLVYIRKNSELVPFISLVMLGVQAVGYSIPLITDTEALFKSQSDGFARTQWIHMIDYMVKFFVLISFLITLLLIQKVWKSRIRLLTRAPLEPHRVPSEKRVVFVTAVIHIVLYVIVLVIHHYSKTSDRPIDKLVSVDFNGNSERGWNSWEWETELEEYMGLVHDFFLLPQIIGNFIWQIDAKPLRKYYYMGLTIVRLLPHIYDFVKSPVVNPYYSEEYEFVNPNYDFYSKFGDFALPLTGIIFAVIVYVQQRWKYEKLRETLAIGNFKLLPLGTKDYERLPSKHFEAELVSGVNDDNIHRKEDESD